MPITGSDGSDNLSGTDGGDKIVSGDGDDILSGGLGDDRMIAGDGDDTVEGGEGDDWLTGGDGDDVLIGGIGNDKLDGNSGWDTARFTGDVRDFGFQQTKQGWLVSNASEGNDELRNIEQLEFDNFTVYLDGRNNGPLVVVDSAAVGEDDSATQIDVLAGAWDFEGDTLSVTQIDTIGTVGTVALTNGNVTYDPNEQFENLAAGQSTTDTFSYAVSDGTTTVWKTLTVTINGANDAPDDISLSNLSVDENEVGAVIGSVTVADVDDGDSHSLSVDDARFEIVGGVLQLKAGESLDYETEQSVGVVVTATDLGGLQHQETFTIAVNDVAEAGVPTLVVGAPLGYQAIGEEFQVNTQTANDQDYPSVTGLPDGVFVAIWRSDGPDGTDPGIFGQRYTANGDAAGEEFQVNTHTFLNQTQPSVTDLSDGGFVVTWASNGTDGDSWGVFGQRYDANGEAVGNEFLVNTTITSNQSQPSVAALSDGGFVVTWTSENQDGSGYGIFGQRNDAAGNPILDNGVPDEFQINTYTDSNQWDPSVTTLSDGGFVATWTSKNQDGSADGIFGQRYDAAGDATGDEFQINTETFFLQFTPSVTGLSDGGFVVTWQHFILGAPSLEIRGQRYDAEGDAVGSEFEVNTYQPSNQSQPNVTGLSDGSFVVTWVSPGQDGSKDGVFGQRFSGVDTVIREDDAILLDIAAELTVTDGSQTLAIEIDGVPANAALSAGTLAGGTWTLTPDELSGLELTLAEHDGYETGDITLTIRAIATDTLTLEEFVTETQQAIHVEPVADAPLLSIAGAQMDGVVAASGEFQVNTETNSHQVEPSITALSHGGFVVTWEDMSLGYYDVTVMGQRYKASGLAVGDEFQINPATDSYARQGDVAALPDGGFVATWRAKPLGGSRGENFAQRFDANGDAVGDPIQITDISFWSHNYGSPFVTTLSNGGFVVTYNGQVSGGDHHEILGRLYDAAGTPVDDEFVVNSWMTGAQFEPSVTGLSDGGFVITWTSGKDPDGSSGIYGQRYDEFGAPVGSEFQVNTHIPGAQWDSSVAALSDDGFVATWVSNDQDGSLRGVFGQRFDANGATDGDEFQINTHALYDQWVASVVGLSDGGFVVTWESDGQDGSGDGIYGQRYDANGDAAGGEFRINTETLNGQSRPCVTELFDGSIVVAWQSNGQDGSDFGIFAQRLMQPFEEDTPAPLDISAALVDTDGSESLSVLIEGVPEGAGFSAGSDNGDGSWTLTPGDLAGLTFIPPDGFAGQIDFTISATATEPGNGDTASTSETITLLYALADDVLVGDDGTDDTLIGGAGDDDLLGLLGADVLIGGDGNDTLTGGGDGDTYVFSLGDSGRDEVIGFDASEGDVLDLRELLSDTGGLSETGASLDAVLNFSLDAGNTVIEVDVDGNSAADQTIRLTAVDLTGGGTLSDADIIDAMLAPGGGLDAI